MDSCVLKVDSKIVREAIRDLQLNLGQQAAAEAETMREEIYASRTYVRQCHLLTYQLVTFNTFDRRLSSIA